MVEPKFSSLHLVAAVGMAPNRLGIECGLSMERDVDIMIATSSSYIPTHMFHLFYLMPGDRLMAVGY